MEALKRLYVRICRKVGPRGLTISAWAWVYAQETGNTFLRDRIDGAFLLFFGQRNHCQAQSQREYRD
jgi:hypothetical protein